MGNLFCRNEELSTELLLEIKEDIKEIKNDINNTHIKKVKSMESVNNFIDKWCETNVDDNVKGRNIPFIGDVGEIEKNIYKKNIRLIFEIIEQFLGYNDL
tara:strand:+ start:55 stop:354 length:300 start_codon:yes stop_codon:yes gene_type:complete